MLKVDRDGVGLKRVRTKTLAEAGILERRDLQQMIVRDADAFFEEMGERLLLIGQEVRPSDYVNDSIDLLALDESGAAVVIELKRAEQKLQLLQALSYAAMLKDWGADDFIQERSRFAQEPSSDSADAIADHIAGSDTNEVNRRQRVVLIAESFDYALLRTCEWLAESYGVNIKCYRITFSYDPPSEYVSCTCVYPPPELAEQASRARRIKSVDRNAVAGTWPSHLEAAQNLAVRGFFKQQLEEGRESRPSTKQLFFRFDNYRLFHVALRQKHAWVWQGGRFEGDLEYWQARLSQPNKARVVDSGRCLSFVLSSQADFDAFMRAVQLELSAELITAAGDIDPVGSEE